MTSFFLMLSILNHSHNFSKKIPFGVISNQITDDVKELVQLVHSMSHDEPTMITRGCCRFSSNFLKSGRKSIIFNHIHDLAEKITQTDMCESYHQILIGRIKCFFERYFANRTDEDDFNISSKALISDLNYFNSFNKIED